MDWQLIGTKILDGLDGKTISTIAGVILGWILLQSTGLVKSWWASRNLIKGLHEELQDIQHELKRVTVHHHRNLQALANNFVLPGTTAPIYNLFFTQGFKDAFTHLNREQRLSYQLIHASLLNINNQNKELGKFIEDSYKELRTENTPAIRDNIVNVWGVRVTAAYMNGSVTSWHVDHHLKNMKSPQLPYNGPVFENFQKFNRDLGSHINKIKKDAEGRFKPEDFEKTYNTKDAELARAVDQSGLEPAAAG